MRQLRLAVRTLLKTPFVTAIAVASLALGIGGNAAIYSLFHEILREPLSVPHPDQLVNFSAPGPKPGSTSSGIAGDTDDIFSYPMFRDLEKAQTSLTGVAAHVSFGASLAVKNEPTVGVGMFVSGSYFPVLELRPAIGRLFGPQDDITVGAHDVAVLSYTFWQERFGANPNAVGQSISINGKSYQIIGVAPQGFEGTTKGEKPHVYVPLTMFSAMGRDKSDAEDRRTYWLYLFGRLKPGTTRTQAQAALNTIHSRLLSSVEAPLQEGMSAPTLAVFKAKQLRLSDGIRGQSTIHRQATIPLVMLFSVTGIVLLIACANVANLLLARGASRATEMGVRLALGASRRQLVMQLLTESLLLALAGGVASLLVAHWTLRAIGAILPPEPAAALSLQVEWSVVLFAAVLSIVTGILFGLFPALNSTRDDLISTIRAGAGQITGGAAATRFRTALVTAQIALSMMLLVSAGLFLKSLVNVSRVDLGVKVDNMVTFRLSPGRNAYDTLRSAALFDRVESELASVPGVTAVTSSRVPLLSGSNWGTDVRVQGYPHGPDTDNNSRYNEVGAGYMTIMSVPILAGREFTDADRTGSARVAMVNQTFATKFRLGNDVVGKMMSTNGNDSLSIQIVGLVRDAKYSDVKDSVPPLFFVPRRQNGSIGSLSFYVQTSLEPVQLIRTIETTLKRIDPALPIEDLKTMPQQIRENVFLDRLISIMSAAFAVLATILASVGLYGVLAYSVTQRTREIGVRMALGADGAQVRGLVMRQVGRMLAVGGTIGVVAAFGLGRAAQSQLYGLQGHDPLVFLGAVMLLAVIAMTAGYLPARRAAQIDPMHALRYD
ncbi:MAG: ABC transporter permease [Gemmatimonadaceae bacterium]|nr:ABC transporter permease [Gemmatimonadaceae bacterium]